MKVLLLGDSHTVGPYGQALANLFRTAGHDVTVVANVGAMAGDYLPGGKYADQIPKNLLGFDLALITLGTNDAAASDSVLTTTSADRFKTLANNIDAAVTWYIGPPAFSAAAASTYNPAFAGPGKDLNSRAGRVLLEAHKRFGARTFDSRPATAPYVSSTDIHLGKQGGDAWANAVYARVTQDEPTLPKAKPAAGKVEGVQPWMIVAGIALAWWAFGPRSRKRASA